MEAEVARHEAALGEAGGPETVRREALRQHLDLRGESLGGRVDAVLPGVEAGEHRDVGNQGGGVLREGVLEQHAALGQGVEEGARVELIAVRPQVVRGQGAALAELRKARE